MRVLLLVALFSTASALRSPAEATRRASDIGSDVGIGWDDMEAMCPQDGNCTDGPCQKALEAVAPLRSVTQNFGGPGLRFAAVSHAVCTIPNDRLENAIMTMPEHAAQRIYKCWSWWRKNPRAVPVLIDDSARLIADATSKWAEGILQALNGLGVHTPRNPDAQLRTVSVYPKVDPGTAGKEAQWFLKDSHARELRDRLLAFYRGEEQPTLRNKTYVALARGLSDEPRIGLVQRAKAKHAQAMTVRRLTGEGHILAALSEHGAVEKDEFEGKTFQEQVEFMNSHDIVVAPHGDALANIPFMPDCGAVVEIFPKGYYVPGVFGAMAKNSGLDYLAVYADSGNPLTEGNPNQITLSSTRDVDHICASASQVSSAVQVLKARRMECLARRRAAIQ